MHLFDGWSRAQAGCLAQYIVSGMLLAGLSAPLANATEQGASVYPSGAETVLPGLAPVPGATMLYNFDLFYEANGLAGSQGRNEVPGFHLRVGAVAWKVEHNWGVHVLGGELVSVGAVPFLYEHLTGPFGVGGKAGVGNVDLEPLAVVYQFGALHWRYGMDFFLPGPSYDKNDLVNIGQHNYAYSPTTAFTYFPKHKTEISSKFQYIVNGADNQTLYHSGNEFIWEYDAMQNITRKIAIGWNGYYYQQTTNDMQNGMIAGDGNRGRDVTVGPEIRAHVGRIAVIGKYQKDMLVRNKPIGNAFWVQLGIPVGHGPE